MNFGFRKKGKESEFRHGKIKQLPFLTTASALRQLIKKQQQSVDNAEPVAFVCDNVITNAPNDFGCQLSFINLLAGAHMQEMLILCIALHT
ncbi:hypothetical protein AVEN_91366-1 [Araneus ventricosus]|uniref:Uncharacterized protein n=1 Tax=Araneus ventricosus TaxID=182803 RepID=A0A4Y2LID6_ARAVE|nr:hypothetical protein AVEN_91366-1 [Araneus ventricosus]